MILSQLDEMRQQCEDFLLEINNLRDKNSALEKVANQQQETLIQVGAHFLFHTRKCQKQWRGYRLLTNKCFLQIIVFIVNIKQFYTTNS